MEILSIKHNYNNGTSNLQLGDSNFTAFTKKFGNVNGQSWKKLTDGQIFGHQIGDTLYSDELALFNRLNNLRNSINTWVASVENKYGRAAIKRFSSGVNITNLNQKIKYNAVADWSALTLIASNERSLRQYILSYQEYKKNYLLTFFKNWSKNRNFGDVVSSLQCRFKVNVRDIDVSTTGSQHGCHVSIDHHGYFSVSGLNTLPIGTFTFSGHYKYSYHESGGSHEGGGGSGHQVKGSGNVYIKVVKTALHTGDTVGKMSYSSYGSGKQWAGIGTQAHITGRTGKVSNYFDNSNPTLAWFKSLNINV